VNASGKHGVQRKGCFPRQLKREIKGKSKGKSTKKYKKHTEKLKNDKFLKIQEYSEPDDKQEEIHIISSVANPVFPEPIAEDDDALYNTSLTTKSIINLENNYTPLPKTPNGADKKTIVFTFEDVDLENQKTNSRKCRKRNNYKKNKKHFVTQWSILEPIVEKEDNCDLISSKSNKVDSEDSIVEDCSVDQNCSEIIGPHSNRVDEEHFHSQSEEHSKFYDKDFSVNPATTLSPTQKLLRTSGEVSFSQISMETDKNMVDLEDDYDEELKPLASHNDSFDEPLLEVNPKKSEKHLPANIRKKNRKERKKNIKKEDN
jgi:hypothetical protein